jgi:hypothetical protein
MMNRCLLAALMIGTASVSAQTPSPAASSSPTATPPPRLTIWRCDLPGGTYEVAIRAIISVSSHEYVVDGAARVTEVNVDTQGNMAVRFYCIEPLTPKTPSGVGQSALDRASELAKEVAGRTGQDEVWQRVIKSYPTTTHSHTIEYRVDDEEKLKQIMTSAQTAFESGRGATLTMKD